jgi:ribonuclease P protein subunit RPR2
MAGSANPSHKNLYSRISYLHQAAILLNIPNTRNLTVESSHNPSCTSKGHADDSQRTQKFLSSPDSDRFNSTSQNTAITRHLHSQLRGVSLRAQIRLRSTIKHTICKHCEQLLISGISATSSIENNSKNGQKHWADVLVITCMSCGTPRRVPVGAIRQQKK